jgi:hypothetical protein
MSELSNQVALFVLKALLAVLLPIVSVYAIRLAKQGIVWLDSKTTSEQRALLTRIVREGVLAAEQLGLNKALENVIVDKKAVALAYIKQQLDAQGIPIDVDAVDKIIEATVMAEFNKDLAVVTSDAVAAPKPALTPSAAG